MMTAVLVVVVFSVGFVVGAFWVSAKNFDAGEEMAARRAMSSPYRSMSAADGEQVSAGREI
jgi:hypothetical protein